MRLRALSSAYPGRRGRPVLDSEAIPGLFLIAANVLGLALVGATAQTADNHTLGAASVPDLKPAEEQPPSSAANATAAQPREHAVRTVHPTVHDALEGQTL
ncbi:hypothetical protein [Streptomyces laurentii]|uniref:hypothetical protein n=1 Tax=Streptomyces laurentii TaxID=39478 RepID=UPI00340630CD